MKAGYVRMQQRKKVPDIQPTHHSTPKPGVNPLISPYIVKLSSQLKPGTLAVDEKDCHVKEWSYTRVPQRLAPFIKSLNLATLVEVLKRDPWFYCHPLVQQQMFYLERLALDEQEWQRLGWSPRVREGLDEPWDSNDLDPPDEIREVAFWMQSLIAAHATGIFPGLRIKWESKGRKPGPKAVMANPHPVPRHRVESIEAEYLYEDYCRLDDGFKARNIKWKRATKEDIKRVVTEVLNDSDLDWSARRETVSLDEPISAPSGPPLSKKCKPPQQRGRVYPDWTYRWTLPELADAIEKMRTNQMGRLGREGKPKFLASAVLGALLDVEPEKVRDMVDNYRRPKPAV